MAHFRERFKNKISLVGRDGVQVNVTTGKMERQAAPHPTQTQAQAPAPPAPAPPQPAPSPPQPAPPPTQKQPPTTLAPVSHQAAKPKRILLNPEPVSSPVLHPQLPQQPHQTGRPLETMQPRMQGALPQTGYRVQVEAVTPKGKAVVGDTADTEWLRQTAEATKRQLLQLQKELGVAQQLPNMTPSPRSDVEDREPQHGRRKRPTPSSSPAPQPSQAPQPIPQAPQPPEGVLAKYGRRAKEGSESEPDSVGYKPYTIGEYRALNQPGKLGGLGAEDNEEKQFLRQQKEAARRYAKNVQAANHATAVASVASRGHAVITKQPTVQQRAAADRRAKALQFAAKVPKPKANTPTKEPAATRIPTAQEIELRSLEQQHQQDMEAIAEIKKNLGL